MMLTDRYTQALDYARQAHATQTRKGTAIPYLSHLLGVSALVLDHGGDEDQAIAGLLHDVIEAVGFFPGFAEPSQNNRESSPRTPVPASCFSGASPMQAPYLPSGPDALGHLGTLMGQFAVTHGHK